MRVVAVFGGGGAKSLAHAGAWRALVEAGLTPGHIVGTSMGAVVGAAFAAGSAYDSFVAAARTLRTSDVAAVDPVAYVAGVFTSHLFRAGPLHRTISRLVPATRFGDLQISLTITATDVDSGEVVLFGGPSPHPLSPSPLRDPHPLSPSPLRGEGGLKEVSLGSDVDLREALYASCALPLYYPPAQIDGRRLADGGLRAVLPLEVARRVPADLVVAVSVGPGFDEPPVERKAKIPAMIRAHGEAIRVMMAAQTEQAIADWPKDAPRLLVVRAVAEREATFAVGSGERFLDAGYRATRAALAGVAS